MGAYSVVFTSAAAQVLGRLPLTVRGRIRQRLNEVAVGADSAASSVEAVGDTADTGMGRTHDFEVAGYAVRYALKGGARTVTVLSVAPR